MSGGSSVLLVHHRDISSPFSATVPHYLAKELSKSRTVHVLCRDQGGADVESQLPGEVVLHRIDPGAIPIVSELVFLVVTTLYAGLLGVIYGYDAVYGFQRTVVQAWMGSRTGRSAFVVGLQHVPVRQKQDKRGSSTGGRSITKRLSVRLFTLYAGVVGPLLDRATEVVCLTEGIRQTTERVYDVDLSGAHVIGMGVDCETFLRDDSRERAGRFSEPLTLTYVGSIGNTRGFRHVIDGLAETDYDVEFLVAGDGSRNYIDEMKAKAERLGVSEHIEWLGRIPHDEVPEILSEADAAISPLADIESYRISFPAKLLEYMAAGVVVLGTDIPAHRKLIEHGENGILYEGTSAGLCEALDLCFSNPESKRSMEEHARETAERYDWDVVVARHERVLFGETEVPETRSPRIRTIR